ncbi:MAG: hypothetical protein LBI28_04140, partial [Treponema sp.]|nr:hypothetical protein [Treponema sp.]
MKKIIVLLITLAMLSGVIACKQNRSAVTRNLGGRIDVTVTNFPPYDFVRQIAGDKVNLTM